MNNYFPNALILRPFERNNYVVNHKKAINHSMQRNIKEAYYTFTNLAPGMLNTCTIWYNKLLSIVFV